MKSFLYLKITIMIVSLSIVPFTITLPKIVNSNVPSINLTSEKDKDKDQKSITALTETEMDEILYSWLRTFAEVISLTQKKHYKVTNLEDAMINAIDAFLTALDPHSGFLNPKAYNALLTSLAGKFDGTGVMIDMTRKKKDKFLTIVDTIPGGPADKATAITNSGLKTNIQPMDKIVEIEGESLEGMSNEEASSKLKGPRGTKVKVKIMRDNLPDLLTFEITRDRIKEQNSICFYIKPHDVYYVALTTFSQTSARQIEQLLNLVKKRPCKGIMLDLRNNSGGLLNSAIDIAGEFFKRGSLVVVTKDKSGTEIERFTTNRDPIAPSQMPMVVLINNFTASAAEILAMLLKEYAGLHKDADSHTPYVVLVGTDSYGKGSVQEVIPVSNNSAIRLTTALYFPNNKIIQGIGIKPDVFVERVLPLSEQVQWFTKHYGRESAIANHIKTAESIAHLDASQKIESALEKKKNGENSIERWSDRMKELLANDNQIREGLHVITLLNSIKRLMPAAAKNREDLMKLLKEMLPDSTSLDIQEVKV